MYTVRLVEWLCPSHWTSLTMSFYYSSFPLDINMETPPFIDYEGIYVVKNKLPNHLRLANCQDLRNQRPSNYFEDHHSNFLAKWA
jgi:hypothetical protein